MSKRYNVTDDNGRFRAELYERVDDGQETYRSATFSREADAWAWVEEDQQAVPPVVPKFPVYQIAPTGAGTYRVTIAGQGLDQAESLGEFSDLEHA
jgi:hypothetical protein